MDDEEIQGEAGSGGVSADVIKSYVAFVRRAIGRRVGLVVAVAAVGFVLTLVGWKFYPRTYVCTTIMMAEGSQVLGDYAPAFSAASNLITRRENLEALVRDTGLLKKYEARRPTLLREKDALTQRLFGTWSEETLTAILVGTVESKLSVTSDGSTMTVSATWTDGQTAMELAEAARQSFLATRHGAEMSAIQEKMSILDGHASKLRDEIEQLAQQIKEETEQKLAEKRAAAATSAGAVAPSREAPRVVRRAEAGTPVVDTGLLEKKDRLAELKKKIAELTGDRERRLRDEKNKLADLRLKLASSHPDVLMTQSRIQMLSQDPPEVAALEAQATALDQQIDGSEGGAHRSSSSKAGGTSLAADPLPAAITELLEKEDADPAMVAQLSGAIGKYGNLRSDIRSGRIDLDTAQAAFARRYKIIVPAEVPGIPVKPKAAVVIGGGFFGALFLAFLIPILLELRTGIIVERWQVEMVRLPVLAELKLPPRSGE